MQLLKIGDQGVDVEMMQAGLCMVGYLLRVDGVFGPKTDAAVRAFQRHNSLRPDGIWGPYSQAALIRRIRAEEIDKEPLPSGSGPTPWMVWLFNHEGETEIKGSEHNRFIVDLFKYTSYKTDSDETPWCAALTNAALIKNGFKGTGRADAKSFDNYGTACELAYGCVVTIKHPDGSRHVTFYVKREGDYLRCIGGNQSNTLKVSSYHISELVASRWPVKQE